VALGAGRAAHVGGKVSLSFDRSGPLAARDRHQNQEKEGARLNSRSMESRHPYLAGEF
jgi:hypothetical protein